MINVTWQGEQYEFDYIELDLRPDAAGSEVLTALGRHFDTNIFEKMQVIRSNGNLVVVPATTYGG